MKIGKLILIFILGIVFVTNCNSDNDLTENQNELNSFIYENYWEDAKQIYVFTQSTPIATNWVDVEFNENKNLTYLKNQLLNISFIPNVEIGPFSAGHSSKMKFERFENHNITTFRMGFGDCWAGCITKRYWKFKTTEDSAEFIESYYGNEF